MAQTGTDDPSIGIAVFEAGRLDWDPPRARSPTDVKGKAI